LDWRLTGLFVLSATALLGSPGPGIAAIVAVGRAWGLRGGLKFYAGLQVGLAAAAAATEGGLLGVLEAFPSVVTAMKIVATAYLVCLAYKMAVTPVSAVSAGQRATGGPRPSALTGFLLGVTNPKAFVAFATLFAGPALTSLSGPDLGLKWLLCVAVILVVDLAWLLAAVAVGRRLQPRAERVLNTCLAMLILAAAVLTCADGCWVEHPAARRG
jgi:threonine/homoserine/homoserine lactone efflux protein